MSTEPLPLADRRWGVAAATAGFLALASYTAVILLPGPTPLLVGLAFSFAFGLTISSLGLYHAVAGPVAPRLAVVANTVAAAQLTAMLLIQIAVKAVEPAPATSLVAIWLGLDVAWDLYIGAGTLAFAICVLRQPHFRPFLAFAGIAVAGLLLVLNVATFPTPPADAGFFDAGPLVGLWYLLVVAQVTRLLRRMPPTNVSGRGHE